MSGKPYPGMGRYVVVLDYDGTAVAYAGANDETRALAKAKTLLFDQPGWAGKIGIVDQDQATPAAWTKVRDCNHARGIEARYESDDGWAIEHRKQRGGPLGTQSRHHRVLAHYIVIDPTGRQRVDTSHTLKGAKAAANHRRLIDLNWKRIGDTYAVPVGAAQGV